MNRNFLNRLKTVCTAFLFTLVSLVYAGSYEDFFSAVARDDSNQIKRLLARGFDANTLDPTGQTGLHLALSEPSLKTALILIEWHGTDVNKLNLKGESVLMMAALRGHTGLAAKLIDKKADVNKTGWTPLHYAASSGQVDIISLLLDNSAYIDAESPNRTTPLMMAAKYGSSASVKLLLDQDADFNLKNEQGLTALDFARQGERPDAEQAIAAHVKNMQPPGKW